MWALVKLAKLKLLSMSSTPSNRTGIVMRVNILLILIAKMKPKDMVGADIDLSTSLM